MVGTYRRATLLMVANTLVWVPVLAIAGVTTTAGAAVWVTKSALRVARRA